MMTADSLAAGATQRESAAYRSRVLGKQKGKSAIILALSLIHI